MSLLALEKMIEVIDAKGVAFLQTMKADLTSGGGVIVKLIPGLAGIEAEAIKIIDFLLQFEPAVIPAVLAFLKILESAFPGPTPAPTPVAP
jgi:hypothetical protein